VEYGKYGMAHFGTKWDNKYMENNNKNMVENNNYKSYQGKLNNEQDRRIALIEEHIVIYNKEMGDVRTDIREVKVNVEWLKKHYWIIAGAAVTGVIIGFINILFK